MNNNDHLYTYHLATKELREKAINLHIQRYIEVGFFKKGEKDPYQENSVYFAALHKESDEVVGVNRLIIKSLNELPTMREFSIYDLDKKKLMQLDSNRYAEMSALTKVPNHDCTLGMLKTTLQYSLQNDMTYWFCSLDKRVHNYMKRIFNFPFLQIGEPKVYLGSETIPCILDLKETGKVLKDTRLKLYEYLYTPIKMEAIK